MDKEFLMMILKLICFFPFILLCIYILLKFSGDKLKSLENGKYIKIYDKVELSKENSIFVIKIGKKAYVVSNSSKGVDILMPIDDDELKKIEEKRDIHKYSNIKEFYERFKKRKNKDEKKY